jgi:hypothetical protein
VRGIAIQSSCQISVTIGYVKIRANRFELLQDRFAQSTLKIGIAFTGKNPAAGETKFINSTLAD